MSLHPMSPTEYKRTLRKLGLSNRGFCLRIINANDATGRRWLSGQNPVPGAVAALLRLCVKLDLDAAAIYAHLNPDYEPYPID